jgi:penicillin amidase
MGDVQTELVGNIDARAFGAIFGRGLGIGSNNWVLSGSRTESGKPLLSNDPHLAIQMPSIWYEVGLHCTTVTDACPYDVEGFSFPGVPGVIIGHNARIAWGVTNVGPDTQDLYIIKTDPNDDTRYELDGKTETMQIVNEVIKFGDKTPDETLRVRITHFGPIITEASGAAHDFGKPLALRWTALNEKYDLLDSFIRIDRARNYEEFRAALANYGSPSQNFVYADIDGNIAYQTPGLIPIRAAGHDGKTPIDGSTTKYDWKGFIPYDYLPRSLNPERGFIATANNAVVAPEYYAHLATILGDKYGKDSDYTISYEWDYGFRATRIEQLIQKMPKNNIDSMKAIQGDNYLIPAADQLPYVLRLDFGDAIPKDLIERLRNWDFQMAMNSPEAALYAAFWSNLTRLTWADNIGYTPDGTNIMTGMKALIDQPDNALWDDVTTAGKKETRDDILRAALIAGYKELQQKLGSDYKTWQWGALHVSRYVSNPLGASGIDPLESLVNGGPVATSGSTATVNATGWTAGASYSTEGHPSLRMIVDLSNFNNSLWIQSTGQSGHPMSEHYRDMIDKWRLIQYNPMLWGPDSIKASAKDTLTVVPKR